MRLLPKNDAFFDDFDRHTELVVQAADELRQMTGANGGSSFDGAARIKTLEEEGDSIVHRVVRELRSTFITPLDRDDTHHLVTRLDDVLDAIEAASYRLALYRLPLPHPHLAALVEQVGRCALVVRDAVKHLRDKDQHEQALELCVRINELENQADATLRAGLSELFANASDPIQVIKWKEVLELLEEATDRCEDVADAIENLLLDS
jgi:predicted phosphate transport protein (TIGR00153 family)